MHMKVKMSENILQKNHQGEKNLKSIKNKSSILHQHRYNTYMI
jgi:hypothetical protein